jgi:hypothetical protein
MTENIQFNEEQQYATNAGFEEKNSRFAQILINWGLASDAKSSNMILIGVAVIFFGVSIYFFLKVMGFVS